MPTTLQDEQIPILDISPVYANTGVHLCPAYIPDFRPGDTVRVDVKIVEGGKERIQAFEGVVIKRRGGGLSPPS